MMLRLSSGTKRRFVFRLLGLMAFGGMVLAGCGDDDDGGSTEAVAGEESTSGLDPEFVELYQRQLAEVGCYEGDVDGVDGPATSAAIVDFQRAQGLGEDGEVGPETEGALEEAVDAGVQVCFGVEGAGGSSGADGGAPGGAAVTSVSAPSYDKDFGATICEVGGESTVTLTAQADGITLRIEAVDGEGTLSITGGDEQDSVDLRGTITSLSVGDAGDLSAQGTFDSDDGEAFTVAGACD